MFEHITPCYENRKEIEAIYLKYTNNIISSYNQLECYR